MKTGKWNRQGGFLALGLIAAALVSAPTLSGAAAGRGGGGGGGGGGNMPAAAQNRGGGMGQANQPAEMPNAPADNRGRANVANGRASAPGQEIAAERRSPTATAALQKVATIRAINETAFAERRTVIANIRNRVEDSEGALQRIQEQARLERRDASDEFKAALERVQTRRKELDEGLDAANDSDSANWGQRRQELARRYENYSDAVTAMEPPAEDSE